jgi:hypothetical protein
MIHNPLANTVPVMDDFNTRYTYLQMKIIYINQHKQVMNMHPLFSIDIQ